MSMNVHPHGSHECVCVNCGYTSIVEAYIKCNTLTCPGCGQRMRASETGEYRGTEKGRQIARPIAQEGGGLGKALGLAVFGGIAILLLYGIGKKAAG